MNATQMFVLDWESICTHTLGKTQTHTPVPP